MKCYSFIIINRVIPLRVGPIALLSHYDIDHVAGVSEKHNGSLELIQLFAKKAHKPDKKTESEQYHDVYYVFHDKRNRTYSCCYAQYHKDIEDIGADNISNCHIELILSCCYNGCYKLRKAGSEGDNGKTNEVF